MSKSKILEIVLREIDLAEEEIIDFARRLVQFKTINARLTPNGKPVQDKDCQEFIAKKLKALGFSVEIWEHDPKRLEVYGPRYFHIDSYKDQPLVVGTLKGARRNGQSVILSGHIDVVTAEPENVWKFNPWAGEIDKGRLYGRGSADMKGGISSMIYAVECIQRAGIVLKGDVQVHSTIDEEGGNMGSLCVVDRGCKADACIIPEPTNLTVQPKHKGILWLRVDVRGRSGHAQIPMKHWATGEGGVSAIEKAIYLIEGLERLNDEWVGRRKMSARPDKQDPDGILSEGTIDIGVISGGTLPHTIPETCHFRADIQYLPHEADEHCMGTKVAKEVEEYIGDLVKADPWLKENPPKITWEGDAEASATTIDHPLVKTMIHSIQDVGQSGQVSGLVPCCDMGRYVNVAHIPTVIYGPGRIREAHTIDEYVETDKIVGASRGIASAILNWCGYEGCGLA